MHRVRMMLRSTPSNLVVSAKQPQRATVYKQHARIFSSEIRPWKTHMVESKGDYREEAFLEAQIGGPLYEDQQSLPRLPIPSLEDTIARFLPTALPLAKTKEERDSLVKACQVFPSQAAVLQERLVARRDGEMKDSSWLQLWWNTAGYLQVRDSVVINVSYFFHFSDDATLERMTTKPLNVQRGASILTAVAEFRHRVVSGDLPTERVGKKKTPLCSTAFKYMFNACRIPHTGEDTYRIYDPSRYQHCIVARKGHFFALDFMDATGKALSLSTLEARLQQCLDMANNNPLPLGWLTSDNRDLWANGREAMRKAGGIAMDEALDKLESGAFLLCLDDEEPVSRKECGELFLHGNVTSGYNRWFDKSIQIFVTNNGKAGLLGEHSMMDGMPMVALADHVTKVTYKSAKEKYPGDSSAGGGVENIFAKVMPSLQNSSEVSLAVEQAQQNYLKLVTGNELQVQSYQGYGSTFIKKSGFSPDAYVQIAMQLATYRLFGEQAGTYEATQVRPFLHGRTETTRTVSPASHDFIECMGFRPKLDEHVEEARKQKLNLLREAVASHVSYIGKAAQGMGVDRHFFGLSMLVQDGEEAPALYSHPLFVRSKRWRVSTSHLTHPKFDNWGYGQVVPDGVGLAYGIKADSCIFNVTSLKEKQWTEPLCHYLEEALNEMRTLIEMDQAMTSKL